jgi:hypothetical protein
MHIPEERRTGAAWKELERVLENGFTTEDGSVLFKAGQ